MPATPRIQCPAPGSINLDTRGPIVARWDGFGPVDEGTISTAVVATTSVDGDSFTTFIDGNFLLDGVSDGTQAEMAHAESARKCSTVSWDGMSTGATAGSRVHDVLLRVAAYAEWPSEPGYPGDSWVRFTVSYLGRTLYVFNSRHEDEYVGGATVFDTSDEWSLYEELELILGKRFTTTQLEGIGEELIVQVSTWVGGQAFIDAWWVGTVNLVVEYFEPGDEPDEQRHYQLDVGLAGTAFATMVYSTGKTYDETRTRRRHTVPPGALAAGAGLETEWRVKVWDQDDVASSWSDVVTASCASSVASAIVHEVDQPVVRLVEIEALKSIPMAMWRRQIASAGHTYKTPLVRADHPIRQFVLTGDVEVDAIRSTLAVKDSRFKVESTIRSCYWDETGVQHPEDAGFGPPEVDTLYVYLSNGDFHPGANKAGFLGVVLLLCLSDADITSGPENAVPYLGCVLSAPSMTDTVMDFREGRRRTPSGDLSLGNAALEDLTAPPPWYKALQIKPPNPGVGFLLHNRPIKVKAIYPGARYQDALEMLSGIVGWSEQKLLDRKEVSLVVHGFEFQAKETKVAPEKLTKDEFPYLPDKSVGKVKGRMYGSGHLGRMLTLVDPGEDAVREAYAWTRLNCSGVDKCYVDGVNLVDAVTGATFTFDTATKLVKFSPTTEAELEILRGAELTFDGHGEELVPWDGGAATSDTRAGAMAKAFLELLDRPTARRVDEAFDALDDDATGGEAHLVRADFIEESLTVLEALRVWEATRGVYLRERPDGVVTVVPMWPDDLDANSLVLEKHHLHGEPTVRPDLRHVGPSGVIEYWGYPSDTRDPDPLVVNGDPKALAPGTDYAAFPLYGVGAQGDPVPTYHATEAGAKARLAEMRLGEAFEVYNVSVTQRAWLHPAGSTFVLQLDEALDELGYTDWHLFKTLQRQDGDGGADLVAQKIRRLRPEERPGA